MTPEEKIRIQDQIEFIRSIPKGALHYLADICEELYQEVDVLTAELEATGYVKRYDAAIARAQAAEQKIEAAMEWYRETRWTLITSDTAAMFFVKQFDKLDEILKGESK